MHKTHFFAATALTAVMAASSAFAQETPSALQSAFVAAVVAEDADALAALYTEDADSYAPDGSIAKGREAIAASWAPFFEAYDGFSVSLDQQGEKDMGKTAAAWGLWTMSMTPVDGDESVTMNGRYTDVSIKTKDGWRYIVDHASMLTPSAEDATVADESATGE